MFDDGFGAFEAGTAYALMRHGQDRQTAGLLNGLGGGLGGDVQIDVHVHQGEEEAARPINALVFLHHRQARQHGRLHRSGPAQATDGGLHQGRSGEERRTATHPVRLRLSRCRQDDDGAPDRQGHGRGHLGAGPAVQHSHARRGCPEAPRPGHPVH